MRKTRERNHTNSQTKSWRIWGLNLHQWSKVYTKQWKVFKKRAIFLSQLRMKSPFAFSLSPLGLEARLNFRICVAYIDATYLYLFYFIFCKKKLRKMLAILSNLFHQWRCIFFVVWWCRVYSYIYIYIYLTMMNKSKCVAYTGVIRIAHLCNLVMIDASIV